jgi:hypothetical protein
MPLFSRGWHLSRGAAHLVSELLLRRKSVERRSSARDNVPDMDELVRRQKDVREALAVWWEIAMRSIPPQQGMWWERSDSLPKEAYVDVMRKIYKLIIETEEYSPEHAVLPQETHPGRCPPVP